MTREQFQNLCINQFVFLDGATGSNLQKAGMSSGDCPETWILEHKDIFIELQKSYLKAGTNILYAPTFTCNRIKLAEYDLSSNIVEINKELVDLSKTAIQQAKEENLIGEQPVYVAGDITMTGIQLEPMGSMKMLDLIDIYKEQIQILCEAGVDLLVVETMMSLQETRAAVIAAKEVCDLPIMATITFEGDGKTLYGTNPETAAVVLASLGVSAIGANCSTGPKQMSHVIKEMASVCDIPLIAKPNAGMPKLDENNKTIYDMNAIDFGQEMNAVLNAGATILGGCCGTDARYIEQLVKATESFAVSKRIIENKRYLASERQTLGFTLDENFMIVGERINPTGKKKLQEELRNGSFNLVTQFAMEQEELGATVLDVNMGMSGIDEKLTMLQAIEEISNVSQLPLAIDSSHIDVIEQALIHYPGRALINSISLEKEKFEKLLPMAKKYGAMFILLPLSDEGLPKDLNEKISIINTIYDRALELGLSKEDMIVDGLVTTVGANKLAALETLETIGYCKEKGLATICGLSNISFGLPERIFVNTAFLTLAIAKGLTFAIANPSQDLLVNASLATDLLLNKPESDIKYIESMNMRKEAMAAQGMDSNTAYNTVKTSLKSGTLAGNTELTVEDQLKQGVLKGKKKDIVSLTQNVLDHGLEPKEILDNILLPAIQEVGELFDKGTYFLPQLIASASTMEKSIEYLEPMMLKEGKEEMETVVIATVEGDIHDIGKNLVALMLKNYGFRVIDLGKDVSKDEIIKAVKEHNASIIALSALMTTTMQEMKEVIYARNESNLDAKVIIGGAVITQEYADEIGADGYSKDAQSAVVLTQKLLSERD